MNLNKISNIRLASLLLYCLQLCIYFYINLLEMNFLRAVGYTIGASLITIITYILLYKGKISTVGGIIGIVLQLMGSSGIYMGKYVHSEPENYYAHGLATGCLVNALFVLSIILLITISSGKSHPSSSKEHVSKNSSNEIHFDFSNITLEKQKENPCFKHIKLANDEKIRAIGTPCYCDLSVLSIVLTLIYYLVSTVIFVYTGPLHSDASIIRKYLWGMVYFSKSHLMALGSGYTNNNVIVFAVLITIVIVLLPLVLIVCRRKKHLQSEVVLSNRYLYIYKSISGETTTLPVKKIKTIDVARTKLSIVLHDTSSTSVRGISNANEIATEIANILQEQSSK